MFKLVEIKRNNGITLNKQGQPMQYNDGYQVSAEDLAIIPAYRLRKSQLVEMLNTLPVGSCLGVWIDNGKAYIDRSARISNKRLALKTGKALKQISIWDWKAGEAIAC
jgi:hypothetical protein